MAVALCRARFRMLVARPRRWLTLGGGSSTLIAVNPGTMFWQAPIAAASLLAVVLLEDVLIGAAISGVCFLAALVLNVGYASALGARGRSSRRIKGDHLVAVYVAIGFVVPLTGAVIATYVNPEPSASVWDFDPSEVLALLVGNAVMWALILLSSLIDWYYIRPRIDGVVCRPPCRARADEKGDWKRVTRRWYLHRGIATLAYFAFAMLVAFVVMLMLVRKHPAAASVVGGVSGIAGLLLIFGGSWKSQLPTVAAWAVSPGIVLGDDIAYDSKKGRLRAYVLHVAVPVVKLVPLDDHGQPTGVPFVERKNTDLADADVDPSPTRACIGPCARLNPECLEGPKGGQREKRRARIAII